MNDTICAIATALGTGAISIIKVSGSESISIVNKVFNGNDLEKCSNRTINYGFIVDGTEQIDEVLVSVMKAPKSTTMEDVVEINCHGGIATTNKVLELLLNNGARLAEGGEFTKRAFLNGRINLLEAEAINDLIVSKSEKARKMAMASVTGKLTNIINDAKNRIIKLRANIEVNIDYPEYEDELIITHELLENELTAIKNDLNKILEEASNGRIIKEGINVLLLGRPNVGKSSILNHLLDEEKAIVTNIAGTTRDIVEGSITLNGISLNIIDTAGIRETDDTIEQIGVSRSLEKIEIADLIVYVLANDDFISSEDKDILDKIKEKKHVVLINKTDLEPKINIEELQEYNIISANTTNENGLDKLKEKIIEMFNLDSFDGNDLTYISNVRQISLMKQAVASIEEAMEQTKNNIPIDMIAIDIEKCWNCLGEIIGENFREDLVDEIFKNFCLGK